MALRITIELWPNRFSAAYIMNVDLKRWRREKRVALRGADALLADHRDSNRGCLPSRKRPISNSNIFLQLVLQCLEADAEHLRRACLVILGVSEGLVDEPAFGFLHGNAGAQVEAVLDPGGRRLAEVRRQVFLAEHVG